MIAHILRQPLLHFFLVGASFFALFAAFDKSPSETDLPRIVVSTQDALWLANQFKSAWRRAPTADELEGLIEEFIREEIYVREALELGLDQGDTMVRRRLRQKMEFLSEAGAEAAQPDDDNLRAHYLKNADLFKISQRIAFSQILIPSGQPEALDLILTDLEAGVDPARLGLRTLLPLRVPMSARQAVDGTFGSGFFDRIAAMEVGRWSAPVASGYGQQLVRPDAIEPGHLPPFEDVRDRVEIHWRTQKVQELRKERFSAMRNRYVVERPNTKELPLP